MKKFENQNGFLHELYVRRYLILISLLFAIFAVAVQGVRPAPDAKVKFVTSVAYGNGYHKADIAARCEVLDVYDEADFNKISAYDRDATGKTRDFIVHEGTYLNRGEVYYIYLPSRGRLSNCAVFCDTSWDWGYMVQTFFIAAVLGYVVLVVILVLLGSLGAFSQERNLES